MVASSFDEDTRQRARERITYYNKNVFNKGVYRERNAEAKRKQGSCKGYTKVNGKHQHRVVMEKIIGRPLTSDEIVHHKDGNKRNNAPDNLEVMTRKEHIREHLRRGGGRLAQTV
jgi:hypothetical protein